MSREAWGDEGNVAESAYDTAMYQEFADVRAAIKKWWLANKGEAPTLELRALIDQLVDLAETVDDEIIKAFKP